MRDVSHQRSFHHFLRNRIADLPHHGANGEDADQLQHLPFHCSNQVDFESIQSVWIPYSMQRPISYHQTNANIIQEKTESSKTDVLFIKNPPATTLRSFPSGSVFIMSTFHGKYCCNLHLACDYLVNSVPQSSLWKTAQIQSHWLSTGCAFFCQTREMDFIQHKKNILWII